MKRGVATVCIPWRPSPSRIKPYEAVRRYWAENFPDWPVVTADAGGEIFNLGASRNRAVEKAETDVVMLCDADTIVLPAENVQIAVDDPVGICWPAKIWKLIPAEYADRPFEQFPGAPALIEYPEGLGGCAVATREEYWRLGGQPEEFCDGWGCADERTQILTSKGWRTYDNLAVGDEVLTLNHETGLSEWNPVQKIAVYPPAARKMLSVQSATHSSFTTMDHRWPVINRAGQRVWRTTETLNLHDRIPISAKRSDLPAAAVHDDSIIELVAWFFTEGTTRGRIGNIVQSHTVHPDNCARIETALVRAFGAPSERFPRRGPCRTPQEPRWYRRDSERQATFHLNPEACGTLLSCAPNKVPSFEFLRSLTQHQLDLFIDVAVLGDGTIGTVAGRHCITFEQKDPQKAEAFAFAVLLSGRGASIRLRKKNAKGDRCTGTPRELDYAMTTVNIRSRDRCSPLVQSGYAHSGRGQCEIVDYDGLVWCPTTANGTWLARRNGAVYFTGNSEDKAFHAVATTLSTYRRIGGTAYSIEHNQNLRVADSPGWSRDSRQNVDKYKPYQNAAGKPWLMRELLKIRNEPLPDGSADWRTRLGVYDPVRRELFKQEAKPPPPRAPGWRERAARQ